MYNYDDEDRAIMQEALALLEAKQTGKAAKKTASLRKRILDYSDDDSLDEETAEKMRAAAKDKYESEGSIEIDDGAPLSVGGDPGCYVMAWVWVYFKDAGVEVEDED